MKVQLAFPQLVLGIIILIFLALGTVIAIKVPPYESSDEPDHAQNIETLASGHWYSLTPHCRLTIRTIFTCTNGDEAQQAPLYYLVFAGWQGLVGQPVQAPFNQAIALPVRAHAERYAKHSAAADRFCCGCDCPMCSWGRSQCFRVSRPPPGHGRRVDSGQCSLTGGFFPRFVFLSSFVTN
jgi:hypothetical protein